MLVPLFEAVVLLLFVAIVGSQVGLPLWTDQPLFPDLRPSIRRQRRAEAALRAAQRDLEEFGYRKDDQ